MLTLLCALVTTVVLGAVAGARRTTTAFDRFLESGRASHVDLQMMSPGMDGRSDLDLGNGTTADDVIATLRERPEVEGIDKTVALMMGPKDVDFYTFASFAGFPVDRRRVVNGRLPRAVDEIALNRRAAAETKKQIGDIVDLEGRSQDQGRRLIMEGDPSAVMEPPAGPRVALRVVGVVEGPEDIGQIDLAGPSGIVTPEFYARHRDATAQFGPGAAIRLRNGFDDLPAIQAEVRRLVGDSEIVTVEDNREELASVNDALDVQALALYLFAAVAAATGLVALGTACVRQLATSAADTSILGALGVTRRQRAAAIAGIAAPVVGAGVVTGVAGAVAASPLLPIGLAGRAEPDPGVAFDTVALLVGAAALAVIMAVIVGIVAWRASRLLPVGDRIDATRQRPTLVTRWISGAGVGAVGATGLRLAFEPGPSSRRAPTRAALTAAVFATAAVVAVLVFGASTDNVVAKPELSGFPWDGVAGTGTDLGPAEEMAAGLEADPDIDGITIGILTDASVGRKTTQLVGTRSVKGNAGLTLVDGRAPAAPDEVAIGPTTRDRLPRDSRGQVELVTESGSRRYRVVGTALFPVINYTEYDNGVWLTYEGLEGLRTSTPNSGVLLRLRPGADTAEKRAALQEVGFDFSPGAPADVRNLDEAEGFPVALAVFLGVLGLITVGHALAASPRRRRHELAILRALGFVRRQVAWTLSVQGTAVVAVGLLLGLPLGLAAGRTVWNLAAEAFSVVPRPVVPLTVLLVIPAALVLANLLALAPARRAAAVRPAEVLRTE